MEEEQDELQDRGTHLGWDLGRTWNRKAALQEAENCYETACLSYKRDLEMICMNGRTTRYPTRLLLTNE